jgi:choice-of-anchor A domain-containing protein
MFITGDLSGLHDSQGSVAVGGNADFRSSGFSIKGNLVVHGDLYANSGKIGGKLTIGGTKYAGNSLTIIGGVIHGKPIDFAKEKARLQLLSKTYGSYAATGTTSNYYGEIRLDGSKSGLNVFHVDAHILGTANGVKITVPHGATVLINVTGSSVTMQNFAIWVNGTPRTNVLWNMPSAHSLHMNGISIQGSILAPNAAINFSNGNFEGTVVGHSWVGSGEGHDCIFTGCLPLVH